MVIGNSLFGFSPRNSGQYFAIDANTGQTLWLSEPRRARTPPSCAPATSGSRSTPKPSSSVARANPKQFEVLKRYTVADSATWAQPVLSGQRVFIKDVSKISLWTLN